MTYFYYRSNLTTNQGPSKEQIKWWTHLADKSNWRIVQLPNGFYQTEYLSDPEEDNWADVTRRETIEGAEQAIDSSIGYYDRKLLATKGPHVVKTFEKDESKET